MIPFFYKWGHRRNLEKILHDTFPIKFPISIYTYSYFPSFYRPREGSSNQSFETFDFAGEPEVHHRRFRRTKYQDSGRPVQPGGQETDPASEGPLASWESLKEEVGRSYVVVSKLCRRVGSIFRILYANNPFTGRIQ